MSDRSETTYSPVAHPSDPSSIPPGLGANDEIHVPLLPPARSHRRRPPGLRRLRDAHRLVLSFCYSDRWLLRWERDPGAAERAVAEIAPHAALTLDVPFYDFLSTAARERALARAVSAIVRARRAWDRAGIETIPLIKGLAPAQWEPQLRVASEFGLARVAFYARESLLEHDEAVIANFLKAARARRLRPVLVGVFTPRDPRAGPFDAAASYHYVLARLGRFLDRNGRHFPVPAGAYSRVLKRFLAPHDRADLNHHNFLRARSLLRRPPPLTDFGLDMT